MTQPELKTAKDVSEHLLKITAEAMKQQDFDRFAAAFRLPYKVTTEGSAITVLNREDLRNIFQQMNAYLQSLGVTEWHRHCEAAVFHGHDRVEATHIGHMMANDVQVIPTYPVFSVLTRQDDGWKLASSDYAVRGAYAQALRPQIDRDQQALSIYQAHLDKATKSFMDDDFKLFQTAFQLPHKMRTESDLQVVTTVSQMRETFGKFAAKYQGLGVTDFVRVAKEAQFVTETEIRGKHESHLIRNGTRLIPPYPSQVRLVLCDDGYWRETHCSNAIKNPIERFHLWGEVADEPRLPELDIAPERTCK